MPDKRRDPVSHEEMLASERDMKNPRYLHHHTLCAVLRQIYLLTDNEEIRYKCRMAMSYGKAMHQRLRYYRDTYEPKGSDHDAEWISGEALPASQHGTPGPPRT